MGMRIIDQSSWNRKEHYDFFKNFDEPFWGIVTEVDCSEAYKTAKAEGHSFFASYLHKSLVAVNQIEEFKYRINDKDVVIYDNIHSSSTVGREDGSFAFSFVPFSPDFNTFKQNLDLEIQEIKNSTGLRSNENVYRIDVIHYSTVPWSSFSSLTHARDFKRMDSAPKITFGKALNREDKLIMPVAIYVHHGLADAFHVAQYLEKFQTILNKNHP